MNNSDMHESRFLQWLNIRHCTTFSNVWMSLCEHVWTCVRMCVCACVRLMHGRPAVLWIRPLKHWAAGQQLACDSFYWNYLFLITIESKFNLFHKQSVIHSLSGDSQLELLQLETSKKFFILFQKVLNKTAKHKQISENTFPLISL